jgi:hypothetical protein
MKPLLIAIPRKKAELPQMIVAGFLCFVIWSIHYAIFGMLGGLISLFIALLTVFFLYKKLRGDYFVKVDENGISWRQSLVSRYIFIPWNYMMRVDYLVYEINFQIKESRQVVSFATSGLEDEQTEALKQYISDTVKRIKESPQ